ncbi:DUF4197 domain-containing protein [Vicingaceae bacterium]|nr:DUF4197 domain-containing protein [Vicingaceae bacterium]MDC1451465.1 DUF4197 domain-containing protein [Vicingaceae bacterium]
MNIKIASVALFSSVILSCGTVNEIMKGVEDSLTQTETSTRSIPSNLEIGNGLKEALVKGTSNGVSNLSAAGGYLNSPQFKIPFPKDAQKIETTLRDLGLGGELDKVIVSLNRAAEDAVTEAKPLFVNAIKQMTFADVKNILMGDNMAATIYLKSKTSSQLQAAFQPKIQASLDKVNATKYWGDAISTYNKIPLVTKMNPDLTSFVTEKAIQSLFTKIAQEESAIRANPVERTTGLLQKVFGYADSQKGN